MAKHAQESAPGERREVDGWQLFAVATLIAVTGVGLAAYAAAASYESVSALAAAHNVPLPWLNPAGIDGGLFGVIVLNIALTWAGQPLGWLRLTARLFAAGTVTANAAAGWPDPAGVGLRIAAPALFVILAEVASAVLLRRHRDAGGEEGVPLARWILAPRQTFTLWRRMKLWRIRDYREAVDMEISRKQAIEKLTVLYAGQDWREAAPGDLTWMLRNGLRMEEALARVARLTAPPRTGGTGGGNGRGGKRGKAPRSSPSARPARSPSAKAAASPGEPAVPEDVDIQAEALKILAAEPGIGGKELGRRLEVSERYGCILKNRLSAAAPATGEQPRIS